MSDFESTNVEAAAELAREDMEPDYGPDRDEYAPDEPVRHAPLGFCDAGCGERATWRVSRYDAERRRMVTRGYCDACNTERMRGL